MAKHVLMVLSTPQAGTDEEYNRWYDTHHAREILKTKGFKRCVRYQLTDVEHRPGGPRWSYLTMFEIETDDVADAIADLKRISASGTLTPTDTRDPSKTVSMVWRHTVTHEA